MNTKKGLAGVKNKIGILSYLGAAALPGYFGIPFNMEGAGTWDRNGVHVHIGMAGVSDKMGLPWI